MAFISRVLQSVSDRLPSAFQPTGREEEVIHNAVSPSDLESGLLSSSSSMTLTTAEAAPNYATTTTSADSTAAAAAAADEDDTDEFQSTSLQLLVPCIECVTIPEFATDDRSVCVLRLRNYTLTELAEHVERKQVVIDDESLAQEFDEFTPWFAFCYNECEVFDMFLAKFYCKQIPRDLRSVLDTLDQLYRSREPTVFVGVTSSDSSYEHASVLNARLRRAIEYEAGAAAPDSNLQQSLLILQDVFSRFRVVKVVSKQLVCVFKFWLQTGGFSESLVRKNEQELGRTVEDLKVALAAAQRALLSLSGGPAVRAALPPPPPPRNGFHQQH
jgi:hypothetical protein